MITGVYFHIKSFFFIDHWNHKTINKTTCRTTYQQIIANHLHISRRAFELFWLFFLRFSRFPDLFGKVFLANKRVFSKTAYKFNEKETLAQVFSCEFCEIFKNPFFREHLQTAVSINSRTMISQRLYARAITRFFISNAFLTQPQLFSGLCFKCCLGVQRQSSGGVL